MMKPKINTNYLEGLATGFLVAACFTINAYESRKNYEYFSNNQKQEIQINHPTQTIMETIYGIDDYLLSSQEQTHHSSQQKETSLLEMRLGE